MDPGPRVTPVNKIGFGNTTLSSILPFWEREGESIVGTRVPYLG